MSSSLPFKFTSLEIILLFCHFLFSWHMQVWIRAKNINIIFVVPIQKYHQNIFCVKFSLLPWLSIERETDKQGSRHLTKTRKTRRRKRPKETYLKCTKFVEIRRSIWNAWSSIEYEKYSQNIRNIYKIRLWSRNLRCSLIHSHHSDGKFPCIKCQKDESQYLVSVLINCGWQKLVLHFNDL